jgi:hypothetical protein
VCLVRGQRGGDAALHCHLQGPAAQHQLQEHNTSKAEM